MLGLASALLWTEMGRFITPLTPDCSLEVSNLSAQARVTDMSTRCKKPRGTTCPWQLGQNRGHSVCGHYIPWLQIPQTEAWGTDSKIQKLNRAERIREHELTGPHEASISSIPFYWKIFQVHQSSNLGSFSEAKNVTPQLTIQLQVLLHALKTGHPMRHPMSHPS